MISGCPQGFFLGPTLFDHVEAHMPIYQEEIFGPVLVVVRVDSIQAAIDLINQHQLANGTCVYTQNGATARYFSANIEVGMVGINVPLPVPMAFHGFGGWKQSMFGDYHVYGEEGVRFYTRLKQVTTRWSKSSLTLAQQFAMPVAE